MGKFLNLSTLATVGVFLYWGSNFVLTLVNLFYPTFHPPWKSQPIEPNHLQGKLYQPYFNHDTEFSYYVFVTQSASLKLNTDEKDDDRIKPIWYIDDIHPIEFNQMENSINITIPKSIRKKNKGQLYFHAILCPNNGSPYLKSQKYTKHCVSVYSPLIRYAEVLEDHTVHLLDTNQETPKPKKNKKQPLVAHIKPYIHVNVVFDQTEYPLAFVPNDVVQMTTGFNQDNKFYYLPMVYLNEIGLRRQQLIPIYENITLPIDFKINNSMLGMVRVYALMNQRIGSLNDKDNLFKLSETEVDDIRQMFFETSPTLLLTTLIAGILHTLFEFLAFQSDVSHWQKKRSMEGTSHASLLMSALAAFLNSMYLYDQRQDTSPLVLIGAIAACVIELWKVYKSYRLKAQSAHSDKQQITDEVDQVVFYWTTRLSIPIALSYAAYTLLYFKFTSFYSWALDGCMALVYLLGFMNLVPQVVLNHRLKSVEAIPIPAFCFRALNTFVDDLFAFVIPMPNLTRLSMLRDDLVFVVFLYQWYKYPKRKEGEEIGQDKEKEQNKEDEKNEVSETKKER